MSKGKHRTLTTRTLQSDHKCGISNVAKRRARDGHVDLNVNFVMGEGHRQNLLTKGICQKYQCENEGVAVALGRHRNTGEHCNYKTVDADFKI